MGLWEHPGIIEIYLFRVDYVDYIIYYSIFFTTINKLGLVSKL